MPFRRFSLHRPFRMTEIRLSGLFLSFDRRSLPPFLARLLSSRLVSSPLLSSPLCVGLRPLELYPRGDSVPLEFLSWMVRDRSPAVFISGPFYECRRPDSPAVRVIGDTRLADTGFPGSSAGCLAFSFMPFAGARTFRAIGPKNRLNRMQASFPVLRAGR